jgi:hypothetical protein
MSEEDKGTTSPNAASGRDCINVPQNVMLAGINKYSQRDQDDLLWLIGYVRSERVGSRAAMNELLGCDYTTTYRVLTGTYPASIARFMENVRRIREQAEKPGSEFIETIVTKKVFRTLDIARKNHSIVYIAGPPRRGKTTALKEWQRLNNHGRSIYIDCPALGGTKALLAELAKKAGIDTQRKMWDIAERLQSSFDWRHTIIVDEVHRLRPTKGVDVKSLEFLRRLHDVSGCGLALTSTIWFWREMETGGLSMYLEQILGRIEEPLIIPDKVSHGEAGDICRAFNPEPSIELVSLAYDIANGKGKLGVLFFMLQDAIKIAKAKREPLSENHLAAAQASRRNQYKWPED